ncbi:MAG: transglutaminase family protein [Novosphingobium sp.]
MLIQAGYRMVVETCQETPLVLMTSVRPSRLDDLKTNHEIVTDRHVPSFNYHDGFDNICTRMTLPVGRTQISCDFVIADDGLPDRQVPTARQHDIAELPSDILPFLLGSRYCETDLLSVIAWEMFGHIQPGWQRVQAVVDFVHGHLEYGYQHARATRTAWEAYNERVGVCRDFAHLAVALCRCLNIPARYCSGYLGDIGVPPLPAAMDFHAWFEVYLDGEWYSFDARHRTPRIGRILMAYGRDAADTALSTAFGEMRLISFEVITEEVTQPVRQTGSLALAA